jgi:hypothetical protein
MPGMTLTGGTTSTNPVTIITSGSGTSWTVYPSQTVAAGTAFTATVSPSGTPGFMTVGLSPTNAINTQFFGQVYGPTVSAQTFSGAYAGPSTSNAPTLSATANAWTIAASSGVTLSPTSPFNVGTSGGGGAATNLYGTLTVAGNTIINANITMNGSINANTALFKVTNGSNNATAITNVAGFSAFSSPSGTAFNVDSANGNTYIAGTLQVGTTAYGSYFQVDGVGNVVVRGNLTVTGVTTSTLAETVTTQTVTDTTDSSSTTSGAFQVSGGAGIAKKLYVGSNLTVGGTSTLNGNTSVTGAYTFNVGTGATSLGGTLGVTGVASFTNTASGTAAGNGAVNITGSAVISNNVTVIGGSGKNFLITNGGGSPVNVFNVDTNTGNTVLVSSASLTTASIKANGGTGTPGYTGSLKGIWSLPADGSSSFDATNGTLYSGTLSAANATGQNGTITGNWTITGTTTLSSSLTLNGSTSSLAKPFTITNGGSPATTKFLVDSANGNTTISGTLSVTGTSSFTGRMTGSLNGNLYSSDGNTLLVDATNNIVTASIDMTKATTGQLSITRGGTGAGTANGALNVFLNSVGGSPVSGMVLTYNGLSSYSWAYPTGTSIPPSGTTINSSRISFLVGTTSGYAFNGPVKFTTPSYKPSANQLKVYVDGVRQDPDNDYSEDAGGTFLTFNTSLATGDVVFIEVDGYVNLSLSAQNTSFIPGGTITAIDVQNAMTQLDGLKMPVLGGTFGGNVSMGSAHNLALAAGTTTVAPLTMSSGPLLSSPLSGSIEFNSGNLYYTDGGNTRRQVASTDYVASALSSGTAGSVPWTGVTGKPTTIAGFGITDGISTGNIGSQSVNYATSAGSAGSATSATNSTNSTNATNARNVYNNGDYGGSAAYVEPSHLYVGFASVSGTAQSLDTTKSYSCASFGVTGSITAGGDITAYYTSDARLKTNLEPIANAVLKVNKLSGITFEWNDIAIAQGKEADVREVGLIAQEVQAVLPEAVVDRDNGYLAVRYEKVVPLLVEAIKEQQATIERQQQQIDALMKKLGM